MKFFRLYRLRKKGLSSSAERLTERKLRLRMMLNNSKSIRIAIIAVVFISSVIIITSFGRYYNLGVNIGFKAERDYYNSFEFNYEDLEKTREKKMDAVSRIPDIYRFEENELERDLSSISAIIVEWLTDLKTAQAGITPPDPDELKVIEKKYQEKIKTDVTNLANEDVSLITKSSKPIDEITRIKKIIQNLSKYKVVLSDTELPKPPPDILIKQFSEIENEIVREIAKEFKDYPPEEQERLTNICKFFIDKRRLNTSYIYADGATKQLLQNLAKQNVKTEYRTVKRGETIISRDNVIQRQHAIQLWENRQRSENAKTTAEKVLYYVGVTAIIAMLGIIFGAYLRHYQHDLFLKNSWLAAAGIIIVLTLVFSKIIIWLRIFHPFFNYPIFISYSAILSSVLFGVTLASSLSLIIAVLTGIMFDFSLPHGIVALCSGILAGHLSAKIRRRSELMQLSVIISLVTAFIVFSVSVARNMGIALSQLWECLGVFVFSLVGAGLAVVSLALFEYVFKITTNVKLLELSDTNNPLIKRLLMETPGTYHHSLVVGNLSESAAEKVGANPLLARVGSYYHDVGKLKKPEYFSENEKFSKSKHDTLFPNMSSLIIVSHVKEGVDLAIKHKLPAEIIDIIKQHHGTSLVYYFYKRAMELGSESNEVNERDFRYPGPKPQSKEAAIIMLADSVEAASRSLDRVTALKITSLVHDILTSKFDDGQLDECDLTLKDIHAIGETFSHILIGSLHQRVKYPKDDEKIIPADNGIKSEIRETQNGRVEEKPKVSKH